MKKDLIFAPALLLVGVLLALLKVTGMTAHIALSIVGVLVLIAYTRATVKTWRLPALEILMRVCYGVALITGIVLKAAGTIAAVAIAHKVFAALFVVLFVVLLFVRKVTAKKA